LSSRMKSDFPTMAGITPRAVAKPEEKVIVSRAETLGRVNGETLGGVKTVQFWLASCRRNT
jgi:hypothetical protein